MRNSFRSGFLAWFFFTTAMLPLLIGARALAAELSAVSLLVFGLCLGASALLAAVGEVFKQRKLAEGDALRTARANEVLLDAIEALAEGHPPSFALYLRPFKLTGRIAFDNPAAALQAGNPFHMPFAHDDRLDIERLVAEALDPDLPLVALGRPGEHMGAGRIAVDDAVWQDAVRLLAEASELIVLLPYPAAGTLWEVEHVIGAGLLGKTALLMPPATTGLEAETAAFWEECRRIVEARHGVQLPAWRAEGGLLTLGAGGSVRPLLDLPLLDPKALRERLTQAVGPTGSAAARTDLRESAGRLLQSLGSPPLAHGGLAAAHTELPADPAASPSTGVAAAAVEEMAEVVLASGDLSSRLGLVMLGGLIIAGLVLGFFVVTSAVILTPPLRLPVPRTLLADRTAPA